MITDTDIVNIDENNTRTLPETCFGHIETFTSRLTKEYKKESSLVLAKYCLDQHVAFESAKNLFEYINADTTILERTFNQMLTESEIKSKDTLSDLLFNVLSSHNTTNASDNTLLKHAKKMETEILETIQAPRGYKILRGSLGTDRNVIIDPFTRKIFQENVKFVNDKDYSKQMQVINACPTEVVVYDSPINSEPRKFEATWVSKVSPRPWKLGPDLLEDIKQSLMDSGYVTATRQINDVLPAVFNTFLENKLATLKQDIETPGFFHDSQNKNIINVHFEVSKPAKEELIEAFKVLEDLKGYFQGHETKLATVFKWGLISPFIYAKKQLGNWIPWLYMYGKARSGKTTLGQMVLYLWDAPTQDNDLTGGGFDTVARVGNRISQSTFPIIVNEPAGAFQRLSVTEMIKGAIERITGRGKYEGRRFRNIPAFAPVMFTANVYVPDDDALIRRFMILHFTHSEKKSDEEITQFEEEWQTSNHQRCKFNLLKPLAQAVAYEIQEDPGLLEVEWQELINTLLTRLYLGCEIQPKEWLYQWSKSESMEDMDDEHREDIRIFLLDKINRAFGQVKVYDEVTGQEQEKFNYNDKINSPKVFKERVWHVLNERLIGWMIPLKYKEQDHVALTMGFKKEVHRELKVCQPLKGISELMGWKYKKVRIPNDQKVILIKMKDFLEFLYPGGHDKEVEL